MGREKGVRIKGGYQGRTKVVLEDRRKGWKESELHIRRSRGNDNGWRKRRSHGRPMCEGKEEGKKERKDDGGMGKRINQQKTRKKAECEDGRN